MLERATLDVLARAAEIGLPEAATVPAAAYDPFFRPVIKKRVRRALAAAATRTRKNAGDHVLRVAFLSIHPDALATLDLDDERAVIAAFDALAAPFLPPPPAPAPERGGGAYRAVAVDRGAPEDYVPPPRPKRKLWPVTTSLVATTLAAVLGVGGAVVAPSFIPTPYERFTHTPLGSALGEPLTDFVANGGQKGNAKARAAAREKLTSKKVEKQIRKEGAASLALVLDAVPAASRSKAATTDEAIGPLVVALNDLDRRLADARVPALLHAYANGRRSVWVTSYWVEQRADVMVDDQPFRVAWGRRIDDLNLADSALYKGEQEDWTIVSLSHMDEEFVEELLAPLAHQKPMAPDEYTAADQGARVDLARRATAVVTTELTTTTRVTAADAQQLQSAIASRNDALVGLAKSGYAISATSRIWLSPATVRGLTRAKGQGGYEAKLAGEALQTNDRMKLYAKPILPAIAELTKIEEEQFLGRLAEEKRLREERRAADEAYRAAEDARRAAAAARHRIALAAAIEAGALATDDEAEGDGAVVEEGAVVVTDDGDPADLAGLAGVGGIGVAAGGADRDLVDPAPGAPKLLYFSDSIRDRAIAAGELATLARDRSSPRLALWLLVRRATAMSARSRSESGATALVLGELFGQLGLGSWKKLGVDDAFLVSAAAALEKSPEEIRAAAARTYREIFGRPGPVLTRTEIR